MTCQKCQTVNSGTRSVCSECGEKLGLQMTTDASLSDDDIKNYVKRERAWKIYDFIFAGLCFLGGIGETISLIIYRNPDIGNILQIFIPIGFGLFMLFHTKVGRIISIVGIVVLSGFILSNI